MVTLKVAVDAPQHTGLSAPLDYLSERTLPPGTFINVPFGKRNTPGVVWDGEAAPGDDLTLRPIAEVLDALPALSANWPTPTVSTMTSWPPSSTRPCWSA